ncbi:MAG: SIS domain-containing protein [Candidatus Omnitrophota bacterium]
MDIKGKIKDVFEESLRCKKLFVSDDACIKAVAEAVSVITECYLRGGKVLVFGNGGSAADSQHMAAELTVRFEKERDPLPCVALTTDSSVLTATGNDYAFAAVFARQVEALARLGDVAVAISTSGNSRNVLEGVRAARARKISVIALTGGDGGELLKEADVAIVAKEGNTARIQEIHITVIHAICKAVEEMIVQYAGK